MTIFAISGMINAICVFTLGCVVYFNDRKKAINKQYALFCLCVGIWSLCYCFWQAAYDKSVALFWVRGLMAGATFIPVLFLHFVLLLLGRYEKQKRIVVIGYFIFFLFFLSNFTSLFVSDVRPKMVFRFWPDAGPIFGFFLLIWLSYCIYPCYLLIKDYKNFSGIKQQQVKYVLIGILIGYISGSTNYFLWYNIPVLPLGNFTVPLFVGMMAYAVIRHRLMDINVFAIRVSIFIIVYLIVLGIPIVLATLGKSWLSGLGNNWHVYLLLFGMALASAGPSMFLYLQRRTENALLRRQRSYQNVLLALAKTMTRHRCASELFEAIGKPIVDTVKPAYVGIYLKDEEHNSFKLQFSHPKKDKSRFEEFLPLDHPIIKLLSELKKPLLTSEVPHSIDRQGLYFSLIVPSFMEDELLSFIILGSKPNRELYTENDIVVFETLSYSMALSIENCSFWEHVENRQRQARLEELDAFSYSVAHEIHNPMTVINGNAILLLNLLKKLNMPEEKFQDVTLFLNHIIMCSDRVSKMVEAIHQFGQKTTGEFGPIDIRESVEIFSEAHAPELKYKGIAFVKEIPDEPIFIRGEQGELMMIFNNFYKNSLHALQVAPIKKITIKIEKITSDRVRVSFTDTGYGIEKSKLPIIFTQFVTTKASTEGSGMGLYVVKSVVNRHKGKIWAESEGKDKGATVILELPILKGVKETKVKEDIKSKWKF